MIRKTIELTTILLSFTLLPVTVFATTPTPVLKVQEEFEGRIYQVYAANGISWQTAHAFAQTVTINDVVGHLATITAQGEDETVDRLRNEAMLGRPEAWVGGKQLPESTEPGGGWRWINDEGPISTPTHPLPSYSNWLSNEPNDLNVERYLGVGLRGEFGWNDEQALGNIGGFVVEFDAATPIDPTECQNEDGCETTNGQNVEYPEGSVEEDADIGVKTYEFTDDLVNRCGKTPLVLFDDDGIDDNEVIIPPYLCGSPKFKLVRIEASGIDLGQGTGIIENEVLQALPNNLYECFGPKGVFPPVDLDPQHRDRVTYQTTNPAEMLETDIGETVNLLYAGSLADVTFECGSSRGRIRGNSYFGIGLSISFGPGYDLATNPDANRQAFADLTLYKLLVLQESILESKPALNSTPTQKKGFNALKSFVRRAIQFHKHGSYNAARVMIKQVEQTATDLVYDGVPNENYRGEHLMRTDNIQFMYTDSVIPFN